MEEKKRIAENFEWFLRSTIQLYSSDQYDEHKDVELRQYIQDLWNAGVPLKELKLRPLGDEILEVIGSALAEHLLSLWSQKGRNESLPEWATKVPLEKEFNMVPGDLADIYHALGNEFSPVFKKRNVKALGCMFDWL